MVEKLSDPIFINRLVGDGIRKFSQSLPGNGFQVLLPLRFALSHSFFGSILSVPKEQFVLQLQNGDFGLCLSVHYHHIGFRLAYPTYVSRFSKETYLVPDSVDELGH
jgi:hypothetical protein